MLVAATAARTPMTDLQDKATSGRDIVRAGKSSGQLYRLQSETLEPADNVGSDDYPQYGDFADVALVDRNLTELGQRWLECPGNLAAELVDAEVGAGDCFAVERASKSSDGAWTFDLSTGDDLV